MAGLNTASGTELTSGVLIADTVSTVGGNTTSNDSIPIRTLIGSTPAKAALEIQSTNGSLILPRMTSAQLATILPLTVDGSLAYNSTLGSIVSVGGGTTNNAWGTLPLTATVSLTTAQVKALRASPFTLLAAPGAGLQIIVHRVTVEYVFVTTPYTVPGGATLGLTIGGTNAVTAIVGAGLLDQGANTIAYTGSVNQATGIAVATLANAPLVITNTGGAEFTVGDGTLAVNVFYNIIAV